MSLEGIGQVCKFPFNHAGSIGISYLFGALATLKNGVELIGGSYECTRLQAAGSLAMKALAFSAAGFAGIAIVTAAPSILSATGLIMLGYKVVIIVLARDVIHISENPSNSRFENTYIQFYVDGIKKLSSNTINCLFKGIFNIM